MPTPDRDPAWRRFERAGEVIAEQVFEPWRWTTESGEVLSAEAGDWRLRAEPGGASWSVRDDIFRSTHRHLAGNRWRRTGSVSARPAAAGEMIDTLEGPVTAAAGDWVIRGDAGECWPVSAAEFSRRYAPIEPPPGARPD